MDPGPGALTNMCQIGYDLRKTDAVVVSHCHPDHYSDAASVIEGMTYGGWVKRGSFYGTKSVIEGHGKLTALEVFLLDLFICEVEAVSY